MTSRAAAASVPWGSYGNGQWRHFFHEVIVRGTDAAGPDGFGAAHGLMMDGFSQRLCGNIFHQTLLEYVCFGTLLTGEMVNNSSSSAISIIYTVTVHVIYLFLLQKVANLSPGSLYIVEYTYNFIHIDSVNSLNAIFTIQQNSTVWLFVTLRKM